MKIEKQIVVVLFSILFLFALVLAGCNKAPEQSRQAESESEVTTDTVAQDSLQQDIIAEEDTAASNEETLQSEEE
jgi:hypothetical protein